jgi:RNA recognition motif-containing protein
MFIGGLNWDTTDGTYIIITCSVPFGSTKLRSFAAESLRNYFTQFGKVDACTIMRDAAGRSRCFAFLTFEDPASVNAVMVREHFLDGKIVRTLSYLAFGVYLPIVSRSIPREQYLDKNINVPQNYSSAVLQAA